MYRFVLIALLTGALVSCETPALDGQRYACAANSDCGSGWQCDPTLRYCVEALSNEDGVFDDRLVIGLSAALDPKTAIGALGQHGIDGYMSYMATVNERGGIHGRKLEFDVRDDQYDPAKTVGIIKNMIEGDNRSVFAIGSIVGAKNSLAAAPVAIGNKVLFFGPATGLDLMETDPPARYIFNVRGRYSQEAEQLVRLFLSGNLESLDEAIPALNIGGFVQGADDKGTPDVFGSSAVAGILRSARGAGISDKDVPIATYNGSVPGGSPDVTNGVKKLLRWMASGDRVEAESGSIPVGIVLAALSDAASAFVRATYTQLNRAAAGEELDSTYSDFSQEEIERLAKVNLQVGLLSSVGRELLVLLKAIPRYTPPGKTGKKRIGEGIVISAPMPDPSSNATGVLQYRADLEAYKPGSTPGPISLEGWVYARIFAEALRKHGRDLNTESFIATLESIDIGIGIGANITFTQNSHQATDSIWGLVIDSNLEFQPLGLISGAK